MDGYLAQLLLKIQINSLSLLFMNHTQEKSAVLKGHVIKSVFSVVKHLREYM